MDVEQQIEEWMKLDYSTLIEFSCRHCGGPFTRSRKGAVNALRRGRNITYCSLRCNADHRGAKARTIIACDWCGEPFEKLNREIKRTNHNFCSQSCAAKFSNTSRGHKVRNNSNEFWLTKLCEDCDDYPARTAKSRFCTYCRAERRINQGKSQRSIDYSTTTLQQLRNKYSISQYHAKLRGHSRRVYRESGGLLSCVVCGYDLYVEVCHIKDVKDFDMNEMIEVVNHPTNLVALCRNHHWEFDHGHLPIDQLR